MKATTLLKRQHKQTLAVLKKLESGRATAGPLLTELADMLAAHMAIEQELFYPAVRELKEGLIAEAFEEHAVAEFALKRLLATDPDQEAFSARVVTLKELLQHHIEEEEEELFPKVEKKLDAARLDELGAQMKERFDEALGEGFAVLVPKSMASTSADAANGPRAKRVARAGRARAA